MPKVLAQVLRKPSSATTQVRKKPASASTSVLKKPSRATQPLKIPWSAAAQVLKKPARSSTKLSKKPSAASVKKSDPVLNGKVPSALAGGTVTLEVGTFRQVTQIDQYGSFKLSAPIDMEISLSMPPGPLDEVSRADVFLAPRQVAAQSAIIEGRQTEFEQRVHTRVSSTSLGSCNTLVPGPSAHGSCTKYNASLASRSPTPGWHHWVCLGCQTAQYWVSCVNNCDWQLHGWTCIDHECKCPNDCEYARPDGREHWQQHGRNWTMRLPQ